MQGRDGLETLKVVEVGRNMGGAKQQAAGTGSKEVVERFTEMTGVVREKGGEKYGVIVTPRNQETIEKEGNNINLGENPNQINVIMETKRKRMENHITEEEVGPDRMQTDGPKDNTDGNTNVLVDPKNLQRAGSGLQARR